MLFSCCVSCVSTFNIRLNRLTDVRSIFIFFRPMCSEKFDIEKAKAVAALLIGKHDFRTFMSTNNEEKTVNLRKCGQRFVQE